MTAEDLKALDGKIASLRAERETLNLEIVKIDSKVKALSASIRELEANLPTPKERRGISMSLGAAAVQVKPRR